MKLKFFTQQLFVVLALVFVSLVCAGSTAHAALPVVGSVSPNAAPVGDTGTTITITAKAGETDFNTTSEVDFVPIDAGTESMITTGLTLTATTIKLQDNVPAATAGDYDVIVTTAGGMSVAHSATDEYSVLAKPTISVSGLSPSTVEPDAGGAQITITGTGFTGLGTGTGTGAAIPTVTDGVSSYTVGSAGFSVTDDGTIKVKISSADLNAGAGSTLPIVVTTAVGAVDSAPSTSSPLTVLTPVNITSISPDDVEPQSSPDVKIEILGTGLMSGDSITPTIVIDGSASNFTVNPGGTDDEIDLTVDLGALTPDATSTIRVTDTVGLTSSTGTGSLMIEPSPSITALTPNTVEPDPTIKTFDITGAGFLGPVGGGHALPSVTIGGTTIPNSALTSESEGDVKFQVAPSSLATGTASVTSTINGTSATSGTKTFTILSPPTVTSVDGMAAGTFFVEPQTTSTAIWVNGNNLDPAGSTQSVLIGSTNLSGGAIASAANTVLKLSVQPSTLAQGVDSVSATVAVPYTGGSTLATSGNAQSVNVVAAPTISSLSPATLIQGASGQTLTINGAGFTALGDGGVPTVIINGGSPITPNVGFTDGSLTINVPASVVTSAGTFPVAVKVTITNGTVGQITTTSATVTAVQQLNVASGPVVSSVTPITAGVFNPAAGTSTTASPVNLTISGTGFFPVAGATDAVQFQGGVTTNIVPQPAVSATSITVNLPALQGANPTVLETPGLYHTIVTVAAGGGSNSSQSSASDEFFVVATPTVTSVSPASISRGAGQTTVTVHGANYEGGAFGHALNPVTVNLIGQGSASTISGLPATVTADGTLTFDVPASDLTTQGTYVVQVTTTTGTGTLSSPTNLVASQDELGVSSGVTSIAVSPSTTVVEPWLGIVPVPISVTGLTSAFQPASLAGYTDLIVTRTADGVFAQSPTPTSLTPSQYVSVYPTDAIQVIRINGSPTGGTYTLVYGLQLTAPIAFDADATEIQNALTALSNVGAGNVVVTGSNPFTVVFTGKLTYAVESPLTAENALTGGTTPAIAITSPTVTGSTATVTLSQHELNTSNSYTFTMVDATLDSTGDITISSTSQNPTVSTTNAFLVEPEEPSSLFADANGQNLFLFSAPGEYPATTTTTFDVLSSPNTSLVSPQSATDDSFILGYLDESGALTQGELYGLQLAADKMPSIVTWDPTSFSYHFTVSQLGNTATNSPAANDPLAQGVGYWSRFPQETPVIGSGNIAQPHIVQAGLDGSAGDAFNIALQTGWNLIGDPFAVSISLTNLQVLLSSSTVPLQFASTSPTAPTAVSEGICQGVLYRYSPASGTTAAGYVPVSISQTSTEDTALQPFLGYWLFCDVPCTLVVTHP